MSEAKTTREYLSEMAKKLDRIERVLLGDEQAKQEGLVHKVEKQGKYISQDKKFKWAVATLLFGGTGGFMTWIKSQLGL